MLRALMVWLWLTASCARHVSHAELATREVTDAAQIAWDFYGQTRPLPVIWLVLPPDLTCAIGKGWMTVADGYGTICVEGVSFFPNEIYIAWYGELPHEAPIAHELWHLASMNYDPTHLGPEWGPGGIVIQAVQKQIEAGY